MRQSSIRIIVSVAAIYGFAIWSQDVKQAYLQSGENLSRKVYLQPPKEFSLQEDEIFELIKPLYGLTEAGDYWTRTITSHLKGDLEMLRAKQDLCLYYKKTKEKLDGLTGQYVDDSLSCGNKEFKELTNITQKMFESRKREYHRTIFAGVKISTTDYGFTLTQEHYAKKIRPLPQDTEYNEYRSLRHQLAWLSHTRPDICCAVNMAAQVTDETFEFRHVKEINQIVKHVQQSLNKGLKYVKLDENTLKLVVYSDSSFANNSDNTSQLGFIVLLADKKTDVMYFITQVIRVAV